ncbi:ferredoxin [Cypionkella sp.]|uniref:ferredoxin n=1 Tax=Cypionkella sp. TaxID=2811411 RepID=UPI002ABC1A9D|nr:ferredoxin [Cypionkella sp.]MDZ4393299.1 ferredoxin [Cypionkella sp.]
MAAVSLKQIEAMAARHHLAVLGGFCCQDEAGLPAGTRSVLLLGPAEPGYWAHVKGQPEWLDGKPDPIDRWSRRVIGRMACDLGAKALFPFGGAPYHPFYQWALRTGRVWDSPVRLLVQAEQGLMVSFRGALALKQRVEVPVAVSPCEGCARPCLQACPVGALGAAGYDVPACHAYLNQPDGADCMNFGCAVRRACPVSQGYARLAEHSAYHMGTFHT